MPSFMLISRGRIEGRAGLARKHGRQITLDDWNGSFGDDRGGERDGCILGARGSRPGAQEPTTMDHARGGGSALEARGAQA